MSREAIISRIVEGMAIDAEEAFRAMVAEIDQLKSDLKLEQTISAEYGEKISSLKPEIHRLKARIAELEYDLQVSRDRSKHLKHIIDSRPDPPAPGYVLVPRVPTKAMLDAAWTEATAENAAGVWRDMLEAVDIQTTPAAIDPDMPRRFRVFCPSNNQWAYGCYFPDRNERLDPRAAFVLSGEPSYPTTNLVAEWIDAAPTKESTDATP